VITTVAELVGFALVVVGIGLYSVPAALIAAGVLLVLGGVGGAV
jgi:hypothetical protein